MIHYSHDLSPVIAARAGKIAAYAEEARNFRVRALPEALGRLEVGGKALLLMADRVSLYVFYRDFWRKKLEVRFPQTPVPIACTATELTFVHGNCRETFAVARDDGEKEVYFRRTIVETNPGSIPATTRMRQQLAYFPDGPLADFTFVSNKWAGRKINLGQYPFPTEGRDYLATPGNNQLFYSTSGGLYAGTAYLDTARTVVCDLIRDDARLGHWFALREPLAIPPGGSVRGEFVWFAGVGSENHIGHLSNVLWRLNTQRDPAIHVPQTDMRDFVEKVASIWPRTALCGKAPEDHYGAHFFANFFGLYPGGYKPDDQFGCSWLSYDLLKAGYFLERFRRSGDPADREHARAIVNFYCYDHFVGVSRLTYPFHTGKFMEDILPFCERSGWGAPFEPERIDSLALPEMLYDALTLYRMDREIFQDDYPKAIVNDVLALQQPDGHYRRLYDDHLRPVEKSGWITQYAESQTWIPVLIELENLTADARIAPALARLAERTWLDVREQGLFAMGGCETDYPCNWDVDGYRTMLWAFIALYEHTGLPVWRDRAEAVQLYCNCMMTGYNIAMPRDTFYAAIDWKCRGMIATSFYPYPDYTRVQCTAAGNQSVVWHGYLLLRLYEITGNLVYAERGIAAFRQAMVMRDDAGLAGNPNADQLRYSIFENNPQMDDESGLYIKGVPQDSYSLFIDLYLYLGEIFRRYGGIYVDPARRHAFGLDCVRVERADFAAGTVTLRLRNELNRKHETMLKVVGEPTRDLAFNAGEVRDITVACHA